MQYWLIMKALWRRIDFDRLGTIAWVSLLVLTLGAAGHLWHHLTDRDCESPLRSGHACASCAAFHGGLLAGHDEVAVVCPPRLPSRFKLPATDCESAYTSPVGPTRGPPTA